MTTIVAVKDGKNGVFIGSDLQCSANGMKLPLISPTGKWCISENGDWAFGYCGRVRTANILHSESDNLFAGLKSPESFVVRVHNTLVDYKVSARIKNEDGDEDRHDSMDVAFLLTNGSSIWMIFDDYSIVEAEKFAADGSGGELALGALTALSKIKGVEPRKSTHIALESATTHDIASGMGIFIAYLKAH